MGVLNPGSDKGVKYFDVRLTEARSWAGQRKMGRGCAYAGA